jgi:hypothetical protein
MTVYSLSWMFLKDSTHLAHSYLLKICTFFQFGNIYSCENRYQQFPKKFKLIGMSFEFKLSGREVLKTTIIPIRWLIFEPGNQKLCSSLIPRLDKQVLFFNKGSVLVPNWDIEKLIYLLCLSFLPSFWCFEIKNLD